MSVDAERGMVFLPIGSPTYDFYGGDRKGQNLFGNSLVALNAGTGKLIWYFQMVHHDLWDYDLPAQPSLVTVRRGGQEIPAVAQDRKSTRLNSSHLVISYAVFCLKKKKRHNIKDS